MVFGPLSYPWAVQNPSQHVWLHVLFTCNKGHRSKQQLYTASTKIMHTHSHTHTYTHTHAHTHSLKRAHTHTHTHLHTQVAAGLNAKDAETKARLSVMARSLKGKDYSYDHQVGADIPRIVETLKCNVLLVR